MRTKKALHSIHGPYGTKELPFYMLRYYDDWESDKKQSCRVPVDVCKTPHDAVKSARDVELWWSRNRAQIIGERRAKESRGGSVVAKYTENVNNATRTTPGKNGCPTFAQFARAWVEGELYNANPSKVRKKRSSDRDESALRNHINPVIGTKALDRLTLEDFDRVLEKLPKDLAPRTRQLVAQVCQKLMVYAAYPFKHVDATPIPKGWTKVANVEDRAKSCLYPDEDAKLMRCADIALEHRLVYGILMREGMREQELGAMKWRYLDLARGLIHLDKNKTNHARSWELGADVVRALKWWKKKTGGGEDDLVFQGVDLKSGCKWLRGLGKRYASKPADLGDLGLAGITRAILREDSSSRQPLRFHDLRASFVTMALATGRGEEWIRQRTGHTTSDQIQNYNRAAPSNAKWFTSIDSLIPEMKKKA